MYGQGLSCLDIGGWEETPQNGNASSVFVKLSIITYLVFPGVEFFPPTRESQSPKFVSNCANLSW